MAITHWISGCDFDSIDIFHFRNRTVYLLFISIRRSLFICQRICDRYHDAFTLLQHESQYHAANTF